MKPKGNGLLGALAGASDAFGKVQDFGAEYSKNFDSFSMGTKKKGKKEDPFGAWGW